MQFTSFSLFSQNLLLPSDMMIAIHPHIAVILVALPREAPMRRVTVEGEVVKVRVEDPFPVVASQVITQVPMHGHQSNWTLVSNLSCPIPSGKLDPYSS